MTLDSIIAARRSVREFSAEAVPDELVKLVINAGAMAPGINRVNVDFGRQFVAVKSESVRAALSAAVGGHMARQVSVLAQRVASGESGLASLLAIMETGPSVPCVGILRAPWVVIVASKKGRVPLPGLDLAGLSHPLENMWLKATELGLGMHLMTIFSSLDAVASEAVEQVAGIRPGSAMNACGIGWPALNAPPPPWTDNSLVSWL